MHPGLSSMPGYSDYMQHDQAAEDEMETNQAKRCIRYIQQNEKKD